VGGRVRTLARGWGALALLDGRGIVRGSGRLDLDAAGCTAVRLRS
jgi:hypothetical protein